MCNIIMEITSAIDIKQLETSGHTFQHSPHRFADRPVLPPMISIPKKNLWLRCIFFLFLLALLITPWDYSCTKWLGTHSIAWFTRFMDSSFFEGKSFGGGDFATLYMIVCAVLYCAAWLPLPANRLMRYRPELGFVVASSLITAVFVVHGFKWTIGRARPSLVLWNGEQPFTSWFELGPYNLLDGFFNGSFPSGHTATLVIFLTLAYIIAFHGGWNRYRLGHAIGMMTIGLAYLMAIARCMNRSHFITDGMAVIPLNWLIIHCLYFSILRIPNQQKIVTQHGQIKGMPTCWELRLCVHGFFLVAGLMTFAIGVRGWRASTTNLPAIALLLTGTVLAIFFASKTWRFYSHAAEFFIDAKTTKTDSIPLQSSSP